MAAAVLGGSDFRTAGGAPEPLFRMETTQLIDYDVARDRERFLVLVGDPQRTRPPVEVIVGWPSRVE